MRTWYSSKSFCWRRARSRRSRLRLDRLIQKIQLGESQEEDPYVALVKRLAVNDKLDFDTAKILIHAYKKPKEEK